MSVERGTLTRLSMQRLSKRFSRNKEYNKVDDINDTRVPLHNEDIFQHGLTFKAKFIGSLEISRPQSKVDIITAMRRIRFEYKVKGLKKQRCLLDISTKGVKVLKRKRRRRKEQGDEELLMMQHPIYRIFYVSHDSQDLKIFSYITREAADNTFQCNVFKAYKKRMALHIVRSLGQAFDVCHKQNPRPKKKKNKESTSDDSKKTDENTTAEENVKEPRPQDSGDTKLIENNSEGDGTTTAAAQDTSDDQLPPISSDLANGTPPLMNFDPFAPLAPLPPVELQIATANITIPQTQPQAPYAARPRPKPGQPTIRENPLTASTDSLGKLAGLSPSVSLGEPLQEQTDGGTAKTQWDMEKQQISTEMGILREQLQTETSSRIEAQAKVEHLLLQNKELLSHLQKLMVQLQQLQEFQMSQLQQKPAATSAPPQTPPTTVPDTTQTPPTTEPEDTSSEITENKPEDTSHDQSNQSDSSPNQSSTAPDQQAKDDIDDISFEEAFKEVHISSEKPLFDEDPFKALADATSSHDKETLDAAFTPVAT